MAACRGVGHFSHLPISPRSAIGFARRRLQRELWRRDVLRLEGDA